ncbi:MAG: aldehyde ferredoxin oxidoreductase family protein [Sphingomonadaceae bacterium]
MAYGYTGKVLRVNLSEGKIWVEEPEERVYRSYLGGSALALHFLLRELKPGVDPLSPDNLLVFAPSILNGTPAPGCSRFTVAAKSPLTGGFGEAEAGGWWGPELKLAGFDAVVVSGASEKPVYLYVHDGEASLRDAGQIWGLDTGEAQAEIRRELGDAKVRVAQIGPAGERLVRYACVLNELKHSNGRTGMGAVMGSKKLRAIAVRGTQKLQLHDAARVEEVRKQVRANYRRTPGDMHDLGTAGGVPFLDARGILPTRNFLQGSFEEARAISGKTMADTILVNRGTCYACYIACKREVKTGEPHNVDPAFGGPEYETVGSLGSLCGIGDLAAVAKGNELCNRYGLDTISAGTTIAFAMEAFEAGYLTAADTGGLELRFGNADSMLRAITLIAERRGIGDLLAEGVRIAAKRLGPGAEALAIHTKGQEFPMHEPRGKRSLAIGYAVSPTGACHMEAPHDTDFEAPGGAGLEALEPMGILEPVGSLDMGPKKVRLFYNGQQVWNLYNCVGLCDFVGTPTGPFTLPMLVDYVSAVTGWKTSLFELIKVGERSQNMARLFNLREGFTAADDNLPERMFQPLKNGALEGVGIDRAEFEEAKRLYYETAGWDPATGVPTKGKLAELDLLWAV